MSRIGNDVQAVTQAQIEQALQRLQSVVDSPRALTIRPEERAALQQAIQRTHAQLLGQADAVLTIALAGCTGAGKSTLINALAGGTIAEAGERRPTTMQARIYHHHEVPAGGLPEDLAQQAVSVTHDRPELRQKVIVDTPDLDTFYTQNRLATRALLKAAGLVIYVFSPERYVEERAWSVIREEQRFSSCLAVINKADTVTPDVLRQIADEIRQRFAEMGKPDIRVLCISAAAHISGADGRLASTSSRTLDEFVTLRAYIEHELQAGDVARMLRQQRQRVFDHLQQQVQRLMPADAEAKLDALQDAGLEQTRAAEQDLAEKMQDRMLAVEADLAPLIVVRKHQRFWGPFRTWLAVADFLRYGLPRFVRQVRVLAGEESFAGRTLADQADAVGDRLRQEARHLQDFCYERGLPVERWQAITRDVDGKHILSQVTRRIETRFEALAASTFRRNTAFIWTVSSIGWLLPTVLVVFALLNLLRQFIGAPLAGLFGEDNAVGRYLTGLPPGMDILWDFLALLVLSYLLLHMLTGAVLSGRNVFARSSIARQSLDETLRQTVEGWVKGYRADIEADLADLREALAVVRLAVAGTIVRQSHLAAPQPQDAAARAEEPVAPAAEIAAPQETLALQPAEPVKPAPVEEHEPIAGQEQLSPAEMLRRSMQPRTK